MQTFDNTIAMEEGWCITNGTNDSDDKWRLTILEESNTFTSEVEVWYHVYSLAKQNSFYHQSALTFLEKECPVEFERIEVNYFLMKV